jgi:16S rRNA processing protein RimM
VGTVSRHRGAHGELTVRVPGGEGALWTGMRRLWLATGDAGDGRYYTVESSRAYRDRLVLKLQGVDSAGQAEALRGRRVLAPEAEAPRLAPGRYFAQQLVGLQVVDESGRVLGRVQDVLPTGGADLLQVVGERELLVPLAGGIVLAIDAEGGSIRVRLPAGLEELNESGSRA